MVRRIMETKDHPFSDHQLVYHTIMAIFSIISLKRRLDQGHWTEHVHRGRNTLLHLVFMDIRVHAYLSPSQRSQADQ